MAKTKTYAETIAQYGPPTRPTSPAEYTRWVLAEERGKGGNAREVARYARHVLGEGFARMAFRIVHDFGPTDAEAQATVAEIRQAAEEFLAESQEEEESEHAEGIRRFNAIFLAGAASAN